MLSPHDLELLTAHVDGELTRRQRRQVNRLLDSSGEAQEMLRRLEEDSGRLRRLPLLKVPADLSPALLDRAVRLRRRVTPRVRAVVEPAPFSARMWLAMAASVLVLVGAASFLMNIDDAVPESPRLVRLDNQKKALPRPSKHHRTNSAIEGDEEPTVVEPPPSPVEPKDKLAATPPVVPDRLPVPTALPPAREGGTVLGSGDNAKSIQLERIDLSLPTVWKIHELDRGDLAAKLLSEVRGTSGVRVELLARDATRGFERLRVALLERKVQLTFDPAVPPRLKKPLWNTNYALFVENLMPEDLVAALQTAGVADRQAAEKKPGEMRFDGALTVKDLARLDRTELTNLLGLDPVTTRKGVFGAGPPEVNGYVTLLASSRNKPAELKNYLDARRQEKPGTIQVFLVVRQVGG